MLQQASVVGRVFWDAVLAHLSQERHGRRTRTCLAETIGRAARPGDGVPSRCSAFAGTHEYIFKHALLRDVTYETVLKRLRRAYHELAAEWLAQVSAGQGREGRIRRNGCRSLRAGRAG